MSFIVKNTTILSPLDLIAPHSCRGCGRLGEVLCDCCKNHIISAHARLDQNLAPSPNDLPPTFYINERSNLLATLIHDYKYQSVRALGPKFAEILSEILPQNLPKNAVLVPLPTSTKHIRERGFDHTLSIAKRLAKMRSLKLEKLLLRAKNTVQVGTNKKTRESQASSAYLVNPKITIDPQTTYVLFDDVLTTGASMRAALKKLRENGAQNFIIVLLAVNRLN